VQANATIDNDARYMNIIFCPMNITLADDDD